MADMVYLSVVQDLESAHRYRGGERWYVREIPGTMSRSIKRLPKRIDAITRSKETRLEESNGLTKWIAFDKHCLLLYVSINQIFRIWFIPGYSAPVSFVTVLKLVPASQAPFSHTQAPPTRERYLIQSQEDLYQVNEFVKFFSVFRLTWLFVLLWQLIATVTCVVGAMIGAPLSWIEENVIGGNRERALKEVVMG